jgi:predicted N-formylglutamate amidohydrolase
VRLLGDDEPAAFLTLQGNGVSPFVLTCDHAGNRLPRCLGSLGLPECELQRHIAWDIGAAELTRFLALELGAFAVLQSYSRLVIDCNRPPGTEASIVEISERTRIPGNYELSQAQRDARAREIFQPYQERIAQELDRRQRNAVPSVLVAIHSFIPVYEGVSRPWHVGILCNRDRRLAHAMLSLLRADAAFVVGDNEPYSVSDETDYTIPVHGEQRGLAHVGVEIRQDLIADEAGQRLWAKRLGQILALSWQTLSA